MQNKASTWHEEERHSNTDATTTHSPTQVVKGDAMSLYYARKQCRQFGFCIGDKVGSNPHPR